MEPSFGHDFITMNSEGAGNVTGLRCLSPFRRGKKGGKKRRLNPTACGESPENGAVANAGTLQDQADMLFPCSSRYRGTRGQDILNAKVLMTPKDACWVFQH